jgi:geranylgeranyl pyrophosphate synthase
LSDPTRRICDLIQALWHTSGVQQEYIEVMSQALPTAGPGSRQATAHAASWMLLPCWCCAAAGGAFRSAEPVAAAWGVLYAALHILDDVEDGDVADAFGPFSGASQRLNASTGLIASACLLVQALGHQGVSNAQIGELIADVHRCVLGMCGGQHGDLTQTETSLEMAWQIAALKSGAFFSLACRTGARLATGDPRLLQAYARFGHHLGMLIQIGDDWSDLGPQAGKSDLLRGSEATLPVAYAMSVLPPKERARLRTCLKAAHGSPDAETEARTLIEGAGAALYLATKALEHQGQAEAALDKACPPSNARDELARFLDPGVVSSLC